MGLFDFFKSQSEKQENRPAQSTVFGAASSNQSDNDEIRRGMLALERGDGLTAIKIFRPLADRGNAEAQCRLGFISKSGLQDYESAANWYRRAAEQGHPEAQGKLGFLYKYGKGVPKNLDEAFRWYERSAKGGYAEAQYNLARCYLEGEGVRQDVTAAIKWLTQSAENGHPSADYVLGMLFASGSNGATRDAERAIYWLTRAADRAAPMPETVGDKFAPPDELRNTGINALFNLAVFYRQGKLVPKDDARAFRYYLKAAQLGDAASQFNVGVCYLNGEGVAPDHNRGVEYVRKAALQGHSDAINAMKQLKQYR